MKTIKDYTDEELQHGVMRCRARLAGTMPRGILTEDKIRGALRDYKEELDRRNVKYFDFV